jgi:hypothetical protein
MKGKYKVIIALIPVIVTLAIFVANAWKDELAVQPEIYYKLAPPTSISFSSDNRIGSINAECKNIGETSASVVFYLKGDNASFVTDENKGFLWTDKGDIFYWVSLEKNMANYSRIPKDSSFQFYIRENVNSFSITIGISEIRESTPWFKCCEIHPIYQTTAEYILTGPRVFSLKE